MIEPQHLDGIAALVAAQSTSMRKEKGERDTEFVKRIVCAYPEKEREILEAAVDRMGWPEINAFKEELRRGQDYREDAGGFWMRALRRLFGLPSPYSEVTTYQDAARAMIAKASRAQSCREQER